MAELDPAVGDGAQAHRAVRRSAALGRAARIEDLEIVANLVERHVRVSEEDSVGVGKPSAHPLQAASRPAGVVQQSDNHPVEIERYLFWQLAPQLGAVDVPVDRGDRSEVLELQEHLSLAEVAEVDDQVGGGELRDASVRQATGASRQMGVGDQRELDCSTLWPRRACSERARSASMRSR
jgi:hypothetical protein